MLLEWLNREVPTDVAGWSLLVLFVGMLIWGVLAIVASLRYHAIKPFHTTFRFWLGVFLLWCFGGLFGMLAFDALREPDEAPFWAVAWVTSWGVVFIIAFAFWAREESEQRIAAEAKQ